MQRVRRKDGESIGNDIIAGRPEKNTLHGAYTTFLICG